MHITEGFSNSRHPHPHPHYCIDTHGELQEVVSRAVNAVLRHSLVSTEPFSHGTGTLQCLQKEMATYRH